MTVVGEGTEETGTVLCVLGIRGHASRCTAAGSNRYSARLFI